jgi:hypothetical protein
MDVLNGIVDWTFLNEPAWRWAVFFIGAGFFIAAWDGVLDLMK